MNAGAAKTKSWRKFWRFAGVALLILLAAGAFEFRRLRQRLPPDLLLDLRAGSVGYRLPDADQRFQSYIEHRYGPQSDPANRKKAFLDFFNLDHIRSLRWLVKHTPQNMQQANIDACARWIGQFRDSLSPEQRADLAAQLQTPQGRLTLQQATAEYNSQDVQYRGQTTPVISQLLRTVASLQNP
jgi:hypothetical protein